MKKKKKYIRKYFSGGVVDPEQYNYTGVGKVEKPKYQSDVTKTQDLNNISSNFDNLDYGTVTAVDATTQGQLQNQNKNNQNINYSSLYDSTLKKEDDLTSDIVSSTLSGYQSGGIAGGVLGLMSGIYTGTEEDKKRQELASLNKTEEQRMSGVPTYIKQNYTATYKTGGDMNLTRYVGNLHENGGIALGNTMNEVEGGETRGPKETPIKDYIFSDSLIIPGTKITFAKASKSIEDKYKRQNDKIENSSKLRELSNLRDRQEGLRQEKGYSENKRCGGKIKLAGTGETSEVQDTSLDNYKEDSFTGVAIPWQDNMNADLQNRIDEPNGNRINLSDSQRRNLGIAGSYLGQNIGNIYDIGVGLKGGDDVNFERVNPAYINLERAREDARKRAVLNRNIAMRNIRGVAPSAGSYLANIGAVTTGLNRQAGQEIGGLYTTEEMQNRQMDNMARSQNAQIQMRESIARQQEADAAKSSISSGLHGVGTTVGMATKDTRQEKVQSDMLKNFMGTENYKADGKGIYWVSGQTVNDGQYKGKQKYYDNKSGTWFIRDNKGSRININK
jgi:hypothetical protein